MLMTLFFFRTSPPSNASSPEEASKNEGFLKSVWHKLTDKNGDCSKPESKDAKSAKDTKDAKDAKDAKDGDKKETGKDDSKKSS